MLKITNSKSKQVEEFIPHSQNQVKMYVCGPTCYDYIHIGNARPIVFFDTVYRYLQYFYDEVIYVRNITDIDDKIINKAKDLNISVNSMVKGYIQSYHEDIKKLNTLSPNFEPRATEFIPQMLEMIQTLIDKSHAYKGGNGDIFFRINSYENYGHLSNLDKKETLHGARVAVSDNKEHPADFALWKIVDENEHGYPSPFGYGRPGWHIECSAMALDLLGESFDIHGGGIDLLFPHHENEIAQSICACDNKNASAKYWLHNGFLMVEGNKMSKSLGNFITLKQALESYDGEVIRLTLLSTNYTQPINYQEKTLVQSTNILSKVYNALSAYEKDLQELRKESFNKDYLSEEFITHMDNDFNIHMALNSLLDKIYKLNKTDDSLELLKFIVAESYSLGIFYQDPTTWINNNKVVVELSDTEIQILIESRKEAKLNKDFKTADNIRNFLEDKGIILQDSKEDTTWEVKSQINHDKK